MVQQRRPLLVQMFSSLHLKLFINLARMLYYIVIELYDMIELLGTVSGHRCPPDSRPPLSDNAFFDYRDNFTIIQNDAIYRDNIAIIFKH